MLFKRYVTEFNYSRARLKAHMHDYLATDCKFYRSVFDSRSKEYQYFSTQYNRCSKRAIKYAAMVEKLVAENPWLETRFENHD